MTKVLPFLGDTELEVLSVVGALLLVFTHCITVYCVKEKVVVDTGWACGCLVHDSTEITNDSIIAL